MIGSSRPPTPQTYASGLEGLVVGDTAIGEVDGVRGRLYYRGHPIDELAKNVSFEEVAFLILRGALPSAGELEDWRRELLQWRQPPGTAGTSRTR